jgi:hypothetical protein
MLFAWLVLSSAWPTACKRGRPHRHRRRCAKLAHALRRAVGDDGGRAVLLRVLRHSCWSAHLGYVLEALQHWHRSCRICRSRSWIPFIMLPLGLRCWRCCDCCKWLWYTLARGQQEGLLADEAREAIEAVEGIETVEAVESFETLHPTAARMENAP